MSADHTPTNTIDHTPNDTIGQPLMHLSALKQATGEAIYIDDLPYMEREMYAGLVLSERAHATFTIDGSKIDNMEVREMNRKLTGAQCSHCRACI